MTFPVAEITLSPVVPFAWAVFVGLVFSLVGAAGGILAAVGHITVLGVADANAIKPMNQLLVVVSPLVCVPAYWRQRRLVPAMAVIVGGGAVVGSFLGSWISAEALRAQRAKTGLGWGDLLIAHRLSRQTGLSLDQVVTELGSGKGWTQIATDHNVDLGKLTGDVRQSQEIVERRAEDQAPRHETGSHQGQSSPGGDRSGGRPGGGAASGHGGHGGR